MNVQNIKRKRKVRIWGIVLAATLAIIVIASAVYVNDYYRADIEAIAAWTPVDTVTTEVPRNHTVAYVPEDAAVGLIFYPGGKVEYTAYAPLMQACAQRGILCVLTEMPLNLAVFDVNAAEGLQDRYPHIETWYIGGHSLGGSMAASYLADHTEDYEGLLLLGSYSAADLSATDLAVLSVYGSEDKVLNREKYDKNRSNLPADFTEVMIEGGCHAYFGMYGAQEGDGVPQITNQEQIARTVEAIAEWCMNNTTVVGTS